MYERWKPVVGFEGTYEVSNRGRVRSIDRVTVQRHSGGGKHLQKRRGQILKLSRQPSGHMHLILGAQRKNCFVHDLVLRAFIGPPKQNQECRHLNGKPNQNNLKNLKWGSRSQNGLDVKWHKQHALRKLDVRKASAIKKALKNYVWGDLAKLARQYKVSAAAISGIRRGLSYVDVGP